MFNDPKRTTIDGYEFQEYVAGCGWEYSHTDIGYNVMLENKAAYADNQRLGGNSFRIIKRRLKKSEHTDGQLKMMEIADCKAKIARLEKRIAAKPESKRNKSHQFWIDQAQRRINVLEKAEQVA